MNHRIAVGKRARRRKSSGKTNHCRDAATIPPRDGRCGRPRCVGVSEIQFVACGAEAHPGKVANAIVNPRSTVDALDDGAAFGESAGDDLARLSSASDPGDDYCLPIEGGPECWQRTGSDH
jgi:hypothetical protein